MGEHVNGRRARHDQLEVAWQLDKAVARDNSGRSNTVS